MTVFEWEDFLGLGDRLTQEANEAAQRTAISRAYYAAYHAAAAFVRARRILVTAHTHQAVWGALAASSDVDRADVGRMGNRLKRARLDADDRIPFPDDVADRAQDAVTEARSIIEALGRSS